MTLRVLVALQLLAALFAGSAWAAFEDYKPSTLAQVAAIGENQCTGNAPESADFATSREAYKIVATWTGKIRPADATLKGFLGMYARVLSSQHDLVAMFSSEIEIVAGAKMQWMLVQDVLVPHLQSESTQGRRIQLFVGYIGCMPGRNVILINEFDASGNR